MILYYLLISFHISIESTLAKYFAVLSSPIDHDHGFGGLFGHHNDPIELLSHSGLPCISMAQLQEQTLSHHLWNRLLEEKSFVSRFERCKYIYIYIYLYILGTKDCSVWEGFS